MSCFSCFTLLYTVDPILSYTQFPIGAFRYVAYKTDNHTFLSRIIFLVHLVHERRDKVRPPSCCLGITWRNPITLRGTSPSDNWNNRSASYKTLSEREQANYSAVHTPLTNSVCFYFDKMIKHRINMGHGAAVLLLKWSRSLLLDGRQKLECSEWRGECLVQVKVWVKTGLVVRTWTQLG